MSKAKMTEPIYHLLQAIAPVCEGCDYAKAHCRCPRCKTCGNLMEKRQEPSPTRDGVALLVMYFSYVCPCCEAASAVRAGQSKAPHADAWPADGRDE